MPNIISIDRYIDKNNSGWVKFIIKNLNKTYTFITNGRKLYRNHNAFEKIKTLRRIECVDFDKCDIELITKKLAKYHPNTVELNIIKSINLNWMLICVYTPYDKQIIKYFFTKEQSNTVYGNGATHINNDYVLYSTTRLGLNNTDTYENLINDKNKLDTFLQRNCINR